MLIDSHCHLDFPEFEAELPDVIARAHAAGVGRMITISTRVAKYDVYRAIAEAHDRVWFTVGTHPHRAHEEPDISVERLVELAAQEIQRNAARGVRAVCFSELPTRLDLPSIHTGYWDPVFKACEETETVLSIHVGSASRVVTGSKDAPPDVIAILFWVGSTVAVAAMFAGGIITASLALRRV